jgi:hypothetical protein
VTSMSTIYFSLDLGKEELLEGAKDMKVDTYGAETVPV